MNEQSIDCLSRPLKILLVEDSLDNRNLIVAYLKSYPFQITMAENGEEALTLLIHNTYDVVFMDIQMPVMDGLTATRSYREWEHQHKHTHLPIAALTAYALTADKKKSLDAGCDLHITKPVKKLMIIDTIKELVQKAY